MRAWQAMEIDCVFRKSSSQDAQLQRSLTIGSSKSDQRRAFAVNEELTFFAVDPMGFDLAGVVRDVEQQTPGKSKRSLYEAACAAIGTSRRAVLNAFADLRYLRCHQFPKTPLRALRQFEHKTWEQLINHLMNLPLSYED
jgi:hypothetical protein